VLATRRLGQAALCGVNGGSGRVAWPCGARVRVARRGVQRASAAAWRVRPGSVWACGRSGERAAAASCPAARAGGRGGRRGSGPSRRRERGGGQVKRSRAGRERGGVARSGCAAGEEGGREAKKRRKGKRKMGERKRKGGRERERRERERDSRRIRGARSVTRSADHACAVGCVRGSRANRVMDSGVGVGSFGDREIGRKSSELND